MASLERKHEEGYDEMEEPSVISQDPNERKLARRLRIQRRLEALKKQEGSEEEEVVEKTSTEMQILASADLLEKLISEGEEVISNVRVANDAREVQRQIEERQVRKNLLEMLEVEADECTKKYREINSKWQGILASKDPLDIHSEMEAQNAKCLEVLAKKDAVIAKLKEEVENADLKFTDDQKKQAEDINVLIERIENQVAVMAKAYRRELASVENTVESERKALLTSVAKQWEALHKQRQDDEIAGIERRKEIMREYEIEMKRVTIEHQEEYRKQKISLETEYQALQQEVERTKALCMMNVEKLDYSYSVLKRREDENTIIKNQQKRRINKLRDTVNSLKKTYADLEEGTALEIQKLTDQVMKAHKSILELEQKSDHFTNINETQYLKIWNMNAKAAGELVDKILTADRIIYEQTLGLEWEPPEEPLLRMEDLPSYCRAMRALDEKKKEAEERDKLCGSFKPMSSSSEQANLERRLLRHVMTQIADHSGFLIEERLRELLAPRSPADRTVIRLDNVFQALSIASQEEIDMLFNFFLPYSYCPACTAESKAEVPSICDESTETSARESNENRDTEPNDCDNKEVSGDDGKTQPIAIDVESSAVKDNDGRSEDGPTEENLQGEVVSPRTEDAEAQRQSNADSARERKVTCDKGHLLEIDWTHVMKALREFVAKYHIVKRGEEPSSFQQRLTEQKLTISRSLSVKDVTEFWRRYRDNFSPKKERLWDGLLIGLHKYHEILKERHRLNVETEHLRKQNAELRRLLKIYMLKPANSLPPLEARSSSSIE